MWITTNTVGGYNNMLLTTASIPFWVIQASKWTDLGVWDDNEVWND